jgi:putative Holliday junction resolvase
MGLQQQLVSTFVHSPLFLLPTTHEPTNAPAFLPLSSTQTRNYRPRLRAISLHELPPNALCRKRDPNWRCGFSLGVDLGMSRTGLALSKGFSIRPLTVLELRGQKLELELLQIAQQEVHVTY